MDLGQNPPYKFKDIELMGKDILEKVKDGRERCSKLRWFGDCGITNGTHDLWNAMRGILRSNRIYS